MFILWKVGLELANKDNIDKQQRIDKAEIKLPILLVEYVVIISWVIHVYQLYDHPYNRTNTKSPE